MNKITLPAKECPVVRETDVLVCGGGPAGIGAAVGAAKQGVDVTIIDEGGCLGGAVPKGMLTFAEAAVESSGNKQLIGGVWWALMDRMVARKGAIHGHELIDHNKYYPFDISRCEKDLQLTVFEPEAFKISADEIVCEHNVNIMFYTLVTEAIMEGNTVKGVVIENREGRQVILAKRIIDATGLATVLRTAGVEYTMTYSNVPGRKGPIIVFFRAGGIRDVIESYKPNVAEVPYGAVNFFPVVRPGEFRVEMTRALGDGMNIDDMTKGTIKCRGQIPKVIDWLKKNWPGCEDMYLIDSGVSAITFVFPKIIGEGMLTKDDMFAQHVPDDVIGLCGYGVDIHSAEEGGQNYLHYFDPGHYYGIGYKCLVPKSKVENVLAAGRCVSCEEGTEAGLMGTATSMATGEAAGTACAISIKDGVSPRNVNVKKLQKQLVDQGALLEPKTLPQTRERLVYYQ